ncbi:MAG: alpha/beta hydrolase [Anaerolineae bacterium]|nr:alpha/beta hydrolase [Anaerolineae bacterium]
MRHVDVGGADIAYEDIGLGDPLLLIHGGLVSHKEWQPQIEALSDDYRLILPDVRGHGASSRTTEAYSVKQWAADMIGVLDGLSIEQAVVCGHSMGGTVAQQIAVDYPSRVRGLILAETNVGVGNDGMMRFTANAMTAIFRVIGVGLGAKIASAALRGSDPKLAAIVADEIGGHKDNPQNFFNIIDAMNAFDGLAQLNQISAPTLIMVGGRNKLSHKQAQQMLATIPGSKLVEIAGAGHGVNWDNAPDFNAAVRAFMSELPPV